MLIASLEAFAHATEDLGKVSQALLNLLPPELRGRAEVRYEAVKGHYDNPITILRAVLRGDEAMSLLAFLARSMDGADKALLDATLRLRVDENGNLYLRFEKGAAYQGLIKLTERGEAIKVKVSIPASARRRGLRPFLAEVGLVK